MKKKNRYKIFSIVLILMVVGIALYSAYTYSIEDNFEYGLAGLISDDGTDIIDEYKRTFVTKDLESYELLDCEEDNKICTLKEVPSNRVQEGPTCWAISAMNALEATLANKYNETEYGNTLRINPYHTLHILEDKVQDENNLYGFRKQAANNEGGTTLSNVLYLTNGTGFTTDETFHFNYGNNTNPNQPFIQQYSLNTLLNITKTDYIVKRIQVIEKLNLDEINPEDQSVINRINDIKELLREGIGVQLSSNSGISNDGLTAPCLNVSARSIYCPKDKTSQVVRHAMTIVGWDDTFNDFNEDTMPPAPGAWIIRNSWSNSNYYYVSYYDYNGATSNLYIVTDLSKEKYDYIYQYNPSGCNKIGTSGCNSLTDVSDDAIIIYDKQNKEKEEELSSISFYASRKNQNESETVDIYFKETDELNDYTDIFDINNKLDTVQITSTGYYTYDLKNTKTINKRRIIIGLKPSSKNVLKSQSKSNSEMSEIEVGIKPGYSYYKVGGNWMDSAFEDKRTNFIKVYTTITDNDYTYIEPTSVSGVNITEQTLELNSNSDPYQLEYTVYPTDAEYKYVEWFSSNRTVAVVNKYGVITPRGSGTATITVRTIDGNYTDTCEVTVNQADTPLESVSIIRSGATMNNTPIKVNQTITLITKYQPINPTNIDNVEWSITSGNSNIEVTYQNDKKITIKGKHEGNATIAVSVHTTDNADYTATYDITVSGVEAPNPTSIILPEVITMKVGTTHQIEYSCEPADANCQLNWEIDNENAATIDENGLITALSSNFRSATITATSKKDSTITAQCALIVVEEDTPDDPVIVVNPNIIVSNITYNGSLNIDHSNITVSQLSEDEYTIINATLDNANVGTRRASITLRLTDEMFENYSFENGQEQTFTVNVNVIKATLPITDSTSNVTIDYDGQEHGITANIQSSLSNIVIKYMNSSNNYILNISPQYSEVGTYTIKYKVYLNNNYTEYYGEKILTILANQIEPLSINNYVVDESNHYIKDIEVNTDVDSFTSNFTLGYGYGIEVETKPINNLELLYTGGKTRITHGLELYIEYTNVIVGDINGDAKINSTDLLRIRQYLLGNRVLSGAYYIASDINRDDKINSTDLLRVRQHLLGTRPIS